MLAYSNWWRVIDLIIVWSTTNDDKSNAVSMTIALSIRLFWLLYGQPRMNNNVVGKYKKVYGAVAVIISL